MRTDKAKTLLQDLLASADIRVNGRRPWDIQVHTEELYPRLIAGGSLAAGEAYVDGWWDAEKLDEFFYHVFMADLDREFIANLRTKLTVLSARLFNHQTLRRSRQVAEIHYNLGNDVFRAMLGKRMTYTCCYWKGAHTLDEAEEAKLELICRKLELRAGMTVLEYGCGWGSFAKYAAEKYGVRVVGVNIAEEQVRLGRELCRGLPVELRVQDYRTITGQFDRVLSIGILEHIGPKNYRTYMECAERCLKPDGIAFIHTISENETTYRGDPWFDRYIFPNGVTPSLRQLAESVEGLFVVEDCHNIGPHYDPTLMAWHENLTRRWPELREKYGDRFYRMISYYLLSSAGCFRSRRSQVQQIVMTKPGRVQPECRAGAGTAEPHAILGEAIV